MLSCNKVVISLHEYAEVVKCIDEWWNRLVSPQKSAWLNPLTSEEQYTAHIHRRHRHESARWQIPNNLLSVTSPPLMECDAIWNKDQYTMQHSKQSTHSLFVFGDQVFDYNAYNPMDWRYGEANDHHSLCGESSRSSKDFHYIHCPSPQSVDAWEWFEISTPNIGDPIGFDTADVHWKSRHRWATMPVVATTFCSFVIENNKNAIDPVHRLPLWMNCNPSRRWGREKWFPFRPSPSGRWKWFGWESGKKRGSGRVDDP